MNAKRSGVSVTVAQCDVTTMSDGGQRFDTVVDSKCYDNLRPDQRPAYATELHQVTRPGARLYLFAFGPGEVNGYHNHDVSDVVDVRTVLPECGWRISYIGTTMYQLRTDYWQPHCSQCPPVVRGDRLAIPMIEVHADRVG